MILSAKKIIFSVVDRKANGRRSRTLLSLENLYRKKFTTEAKSDSLFISSGASERG